MEQLLISKTEISEFFPLSKNLNDDRVNPYILRAQRTKLEQLLGYELYKIFVEDASAVATFGTVKYQELFDGKDYTFDGKPRLFHGVKPLLCAYAYANILQNNSSHITRAGTVKKLTDESEPETLSHEYQLIRNAMESAAPLASGLRDFLESNKATYPEYQPLSYDQESGLKISRLRSPKHKYYNVGE